MTVQIKKVGPGQEYTTLQSAEDAASISSTKDDPWWFELYTSPDLGETVFVTWTDPPTQESERVKIYVADGEQHNGVSGGARIVSDGAIGLSVIGISFVTIEGLHVICASTSAGISFAGGADQAVVESVLMDGGGTSIRTWVLNGGNQVVRNCISRDCVGDDYFVASAINTDFTIQGCLSHNSTGSGIRITENKGAAVNAVIENNIVMGSGTNYLTSSDSGTRTVNNNISSDDTADDWGGTGNLINQVETDLFNNVTVDDFTHAENSPARDTGKTILAMTDDILGNLRPQNFIYDIGPYEKLILVPRGTLDETNIFLSDLIAKRLFPSEGGNSQRMIEQYGGSMTEMLAFEPDPATYRGTYYYNTVKNVLYRKVITEKNAKTGAIIAHWQSASMSR